MIQFSDGDGAAQPPLTPEELRVWRREARGRNLLPPERIVWPDPTPTTPEERQLLAKVPPPNPPPPKNLEAHFIQEQNMRQWLAQDKARHAEWCALSVQRKSQLESDRQFGDETQPLWVVRLVAQGKHPESGCPPLAVRAANEREAEERYRALCGLTWVDQDHHQFDITPYRAPAA
jgi:hypothetical protein